ncbi:MAG: hypothetical protein SV775_18140 [Thermodesulfobacteriota bacterium]|nr:hypothetical protein [Thermodesulfobacteriota bacterium]
MKKLIFALFAVSIWFDSSPAKQITGEGFGATRKEAKEESLADLIQNIQVEVKSEFSSTKTVKTRSYEETRNKVINLKSDLPVLGVTYALREEVDGFLSRAILDYSAVNLYESSLKNTREMIERDMRVLKGLKSNSEKEAILREVLAGLDQYYKYRIVAQFLGSESIPEIDITRAEIKARISRLSEKADTLDFGARTAAGAFREKNIYIFPPATENSREITEFASAVKDRLSAHMDTAISPKIADYYLMGRYRELEDGIELTCHLLDKQYNTVRTSVVSYLPAAYKEYETRPKTIDFDKLLNTGVVASKDLRPAISTSMGTRDLLFKKGETFSLLAKMNRPGYFYLVVHVLKAAEEYSYIIDLQEGGGNRKFVYFVNADDVNKWVELGEFEVVPPYGVETVQMMASTRDLVDKIPQTHYDIKTRLFKIGNDPSSAVLRTRGLIRKERLNKEEGTSATKACFAEANLLLTTIEK